MLNKIHFLINKDSLKNRVELTKHIELKSNESSFSFKFSVVDNLLSNNYRYAYKLHGVDHDWIISKNDQEAIYTNVPSGDYIFEVKAGHTKGAWDIEPIQLSIKIKPQWWASNLAYILYFVLALLLSFSIVTWIRLKNRLIKEEWQNQKNKELYDMKINFFAKMSHEIQTPLTLVLSPIEDMVERASINGNVLLKQRLIMINSNLRRLSRIAAQLMIIRNKEVGNLKIHASKNNITDDLKKICTSFEEQARFKNIDFTQEYPKDDIYLWYDKDKIEDVFYNLFSNAFKFTPKDGNIQLEVVKNPNEEWINIYVKDSGPGISKEESDSIFELFYQADLGKKNVGSGIGLALTKELIDLHHGEINLHSSSEFGTSFQIKLSLKDDVFTKDEKIYVEQSKSIADSIEKNPKPLDKDLNTNIESEDNKKHHVLIVEDNIEMQIFLKNILSKSYHVSIAENGLEGIELAQKILPDLIISDIMMPKMDGIEMSKTIHNNKTTAHIPIIILTANNSESSKITGLKSGAIAYINKPFNVQELLLKIANITSANENILLKLKAEILSIPKQSIIKSKDDIFLDNLVSELDKQIENPEFKLEDLSKALNMSYSTIFRKCQELTGKTLVDFFRTLRLKKAAILIVEYGYNSSEAAFMIGFNDYRCFSKCFKKEFGKSPNKYKKEWINSRADEIK
ncbi:response regulator [Gelidibacter japonicus]|uniref:hybrid sensor histidine kinase/response regulator transcription factor n=1 Tax=Gelidibacter japonicus TaxID=1962232 RepID=UPI002AFEE6AA|nr:response regulator [Gelidibacter japonicus]